MRDYNTIEPVNADRSDSPTMLVTDDELDGIEETDHPDGPAKKKKKKGDKRTGWVSAMVFIMRQSYVLSLIAMMVCQ